MFHERVNDIQQFWNFLNLIDKDPVETAQAGKCLAGQVLGTANKMFEFIGI